MKDVFGKSAALLTILLLAVSLLASASLDAAAFENEPIGFRGMRWDTSLLKVPGLVLAEKDGQIKSYTKTGDVLTLGGATLDSLEYTYYRDKFYSVYITFNNPVNYDALKKYTFEVYGQGESESNMWQKKWWWLGEDVNIRLEYSMVMREGTLCFTYLPLYQQVEAARLEAARGGLDED